MRNRHKTIQQLTEDLKVRPWTNVPATKVIAEEKRIKLAREMVVSALDDDPSDDGMDDREDMDDDGDDTGPEPAPEPAPVSKRKKPKATSSRQ